jgi:hypothetical protein
MAGNENENVCCCFCGNWLSGREAVRLAITTEEMEGESQVMFSHKSCLVTRIHPAVPLHPDLLE